MSSETSLAAIWAEMKQDDSKDRAEVKKRSQALGAGGMVGVTKLMKEKNIKGYAAGSEKKKGKPNKEFTKSGAAIIAPAELLVSAKLSADSTMVASSVAAQPSHDISFSAALSSVTREATASETGSSMERRKALQNIIKTLKAADSSLTSSEYAEIFIDISKQIFRRFADETEKCRELAFTITELLFLRAGNILPILAYFLPALMQRIPPSGAYDDDLKIFVLDIESHEAYKRGRAVDRQDRGESVRTHLIVETSEEIRLVAVKCMATLVNKVVSSGACSVLQPYFTEVVVFLQSQLRDPFGDIRAVACGVLTVLAVQPEFELGMKFYAVALVRALLPVMRHKHAKVRCAAVDAIKVCVMVPDRAKRKGAGTAAIQDLVGFHEENVLPISAFYKAEIQINYMAEIVSDASALVRERVVIMLTAFLTELEDRYDHQTRLLPYLLDLLADDADAVSSIALACLSKCGQQYEEEHQDEILERRQYGVDGDGRINLDKPLPAPFTNRPRLGVRLFVRGNTKRFLVALLNELTNWISKTRVKSCKLLKVVVVLVEEHLAMESFQVLPMFVKAIGFATADKDHELKALLLDTIELLGRYMSPDIYTHFILPRLTGDVEVVQFGVDAHSRMSVLAVLRQLIKGTKPSQLPQYIPALVATLVDPLVIDPDSLAVRGAGLDVSLELLRAVAGGSNAAATVSAVEAHFMTTGRLSSLHSTIRSMFRRLVTDLSEPELVERASEALTLLASLEGGKVMATGMGSTQKIQYLFNQHASPVMRELLKDEGSFEINTVSNAPDWPATDKNVIQLVCRLLECPWQCVQADVSCFDALLRHLCAAGANPGNEPNTLVLLLNAAILCVQPICLAILQVTGDGTEAPRDVFVPPAYRYILHQAQYIPPQRQEVFRDSIQAFAPKSDEASENGLLKGLLDVFVLNSALAPATGARTFPSSETAIAEVSIDLHRKRLVLVSMLLGISNRVAVQFNDTKSKLLCLTESDMRHVASSVLGRARAEFLLHGAAVLVQSVVERAATPTSPTDIRRRGLQIADTIITICLHGKSLKLVSFARRLSASVHGQENLLLEAAVTGNKPLIYQLSSSPSIIPPHILLVGPVLLPLLLSFLDDSSDAVRCMTARSLCLAMHFVVPDEASTATGASCEYSHVTTSILNHMVRVLSLRHPNIIDDNQLEFIDEMDVALRSLACLDPAAFEVLVRSQLDAVMFSELAADRKDSIVSLFSDLISHCDILTQLSTATSK